jgi:hypothetical protein
MDEEYPWTMKCRGVTVQGVVGVTPSRSKEFALISEACVAGLIKLSAGGLENHWKDQLCDNLVQCGGRSEFVAKRTDYGDIEVDKVPGVSETILKLIEYERAELRRSLGMFWLVTRHRL